jgi:hypothetical protein
LDWAAPALQSAAKSLAERRKIRLAAALAFAENPFITLFCRRKFSGGTGFSTALQGVATVRAVRTFAR